MTSNEADNRFNRIIDIIITLVTETSLLVGLKLLLQLIIIGIPVVAITLVFQALIRLIERGLLVYILLIREESRKKLTLRLFLKRIK